jgi:hypothetical protein
VIIVLVAALLWLLPGLASAQKWVSFKPNKKGKTMFKVVSPEGASASITGEDGVNASGDVPLSADVEDDHFYRVTVTWKGKTYTTKIEAQDGQEGIIAVPTAAFDETPEERAKREKIEADLEKRRRQHERERERPRDKPKLGAYDAQPMIEDDFQKVWKQLEKKKDNKERIVRLKAVCKKSDHFSVGHMLRILKLTSDESERLDLLRAVRGCVADHSNKPKIAAAFKDEDNKDSAVKILDERE